MNSEGSQWDRQIGAAISEALRQNQLEDFKRLLQENPSYLLRDGKEKWMRSAALKGNLRAIQILIELGLDINRPEHPPSHELHEPEGPIVGAATHGHIDIVRWMLDHGAQVNFEFKGLKRCVPLVCAATNGHLDIVKLLVERGADIHATGGWANVTPITQAALYGKQDVYDYLYSLGARDVRENTPPK
ncbi:MAG: ankyrin repeat domain-containing protein [Thermomicrobiales bacterium]